MKVPKPIFKERPRYSSFVLINIVCPSLSVVDCRHLLGFVHCCTLCCVGVKVAICLPISLTGQNPFADEYSLPDFRYSPNSFVSVSSAIIDP